MRAALVRLLRSRPLRAVLLLGVLGCGAPHAHAQAFFCSAGATGVAFGTYTPMTPAPLVSTGSVTVQCFTFVPASVTISLSTGASGTYTPRSLVSGTSTLHYNLFLNAAMTQIWGNGNGGSQSESLTVTGFPGSATATIYGAIAQLQDPAPGTYTDTITVTVNY
jgi:spore coat protein U-like protein